MSTEANNVMKKLLQKMSNHLLSLKEFKDIDKVDIFFAFTSKHKTAMCQTVYGMKIQTSLSRMNRDNVVRELQTKLKKMADVSFQHSVCATDIIFEND
jgi:hypothetical protein